jgi:hypothetical protein
MLVLMNTDRDETVLRPNSIFDGKIPSGCSSLEIRPLGASLFISNKERELKYYNQIYSTNIINNLTKKINKFRNFQRNLVVVEDKNEMGLIILSLVLIINKFKHSFCFLD